MAVGGGLQAHRLKVEWVRLCKEVIFTPDNNPDVIPLTLFGAPGTERPDDIVAFTAVRSNQETQPLATTHPREESIELDGIISVFRGGGQEAEQQSAEAAYGYLSQIEEYARSVDPTISGLVRWCLLDSHESDGWTVGDTSPGRNIVVDFTLKAAYRIR